MFDNHLNQTAVPSSLVSGLQCFFVRPGSLILAGFYITFILITVPFSFLVIYHGLQEWRQKRSPSSTAMRHSDYFTYHTAVFDLVGVFGAVVCCSCILRENHDIILHGGILWSSSWYGQTCFQILTSLEHYLAVVHPVTYLSLRQERGIRIRNIGTVFVWIVSLAGTSVFFVEGFSLLSMCLLMIAIAVLSYWSLSVLRVLLNGGPAEQRVSQSKKRAFYTIVTILGILVLRFTGSIAWSIVVLSNTKEKCVIVASAIWITLPSSLVFPLLFLQRAEKAKCCVFE